MKHFYGCAISSIEPRTATECTDTVHMGSYTHYARRDERPKRLIESTAKKIAVNGRRSMLAGDDESKTVIGKAICFNRGYDASTKNRPTYP